MRMTVSFAAMIAVSGLLSACGGSGDGGNAGAAAPAGAASGGDALVGGWTEADACKTLDKSDVLYVGLSQFAGLYQVNVHVPVGKASFTPAQIADNARVGGILN